MDGASNSARHQTLSYVGHGFSRAERGAAEAAPYIPNEAPLKRRPTSDFQLSEEWLPRARRIEAEARERDDERDREIAGERGP